jgi:hypothetical protein
MSENKQPTKEQIKKFWEWCGFKPITTAEKYPEISTNRPDDIVAWNYPDGNGDYHLPEIDLNNIFRYAVPKLLNGQCELYTSIGDKRGSCLARVWFGFYEHKEAYNNDPALALFWVIWQVIECQKN